MCAESAVKHQTNKQLTCMPSIRPSQQWRNLWDLITTGFLYRSGVLPVAQRTVSKHWMVTFWDCWKDAFYRRIPFQTSNRQRLGWGWGGLGNHPLREFAALCPVWRKENWKLKFLKYHRNRFFSRNSNVLNFVLYFQTAAHFCCKGVPRDSSERSARPHLS